MESTGITTITVATAIFSAVRLLPGTIPQLQVLKFLQLIAYSITRTIYLLSFHPLSEFLGPRLAAVSNLWYAYHWLSGRYPWAIEDAIRKYGSIVRIAPNELVFFTPQAFTDIYLPQHKHMEDFVKTDFQNRGKTSVAWSGRKTRLSIAASRDRLLRRSAVDF
jgi:hypothetical protein